MKRIALLSLYFIACSHGADAPLAQVDSSAGGSSGSTGSGGSALGGGAGGSGTPSGGSSGSAAAGTGNAVGGSGTIPCVPSSLEPIVGEGATDDGPTLPLTVQVLRTVNIGNPSSPEGWKSASGFSLQGFVPNKDWPVQPGSLCKLHPKSDPNAIYITNESRGINAFSRTILPLLKGKLGLSSEALNQAIETGSFTWALNVLPPNPLGEYPGPEWLVSGTIEGEVSWTKNSMKFAAFDLSLNPSSSKISPKWRFGEGYEGSSGNFYGSKSTGYPFDLVWRWGAHATRLRVHRASTMGYISSDGSSAEGDFSGILSVKDVQAEVARLVGNTSSSCCSQEMTELMQAIERAADFPTTAITGSDTTCDGISFALTYTTVLQKLVGTNAAPTFESACEQ